MQVARECCSMECCGTLEGFLLLRLGQSCCCVDAQSQPCIESTLFSTLELHGAQSNPNSVVISGTGNLCPRPRWRCSLSLARGFHQQPCARIPEPLLKDSESLEQVMSEQERSIKGSGCSYSYYLFLLLLQLFLLLLLRCRHKSLLHELHERPHRELEVGLNIYQGRGTDAYITI